MATFRITMTDGVENELVAQRVSMDDELTRFESRRDGGWEIARAVPSAAVAEVKRKVIESNGLVRWVSARPSRPAGADAERGAVPVE